MTLPTSESIPDNFNDLPPAQKRRIRHSLRGASESELKSLLFELQRRSTPAYEFFLLTLLGALLAGMALVIDSALLLAAAAICVPILTPLMGVAISPALRRLPFLLQSLASLLISLIFHFGFGVLAGVIASGMGRPTWQHIPVLTYTHWIGWVVLLITALLAGFLFLRYEINPRMAGVMISYLVFIPISSAGFLLTKPGNAAWSDSLLTGFIFLMAAIFVTTLIFLILGLIPKKSVGWLIFLVAPTAMILMIMLGGGNIAPSTGQPDPLVAETPCPAVTCEADADVPICVLPDTPTATQVEVATSTPTLVKTATPTPAPTPTWGRVDAENGAVIREGPGFENPIVAYASDGELLQMLPETFINGNILWVKVIATNQTEGWILASLLITPQP